MEVASALYTAPGTQKPKLVNKIYGLGGRDFMPEHAEAVFQELQELAQGAEVKTVKEYIGVRE
jgi:pyruvate ferredoxin oxidoreductase alpha subunit